MVNISQNNFQQFVGQNGAPVCKPKQRVVGEHCPDSQRPGVQDSLVAKSTECLEEDSGTLYGG